ncbi:hypothetical protein ED733_007344 [Metarhizium rileyi]|uniref:Cupredoxin n=1 Tax=Metarhizium rileyi (strain RCEF 4871) TaxID=1649241 RepID=A0A5C6GFE4_METRR|nr:hypothetical protein ED733_007344 [Metarhizium rileyi]
MKFSTTLFTAVAPVAMARRIANIFPPPAGIFARSNAGVQSGENGVSVGSTDGQSVSPSVSANARTEVIIIWSNPGNGASKTPANTTLQQGQSPTVPGAGASHTVKVGGPGGLTFQPDQLKDVPVGDTIVFEFLSQNHTVTQSPFDTPCKAMPGGMDSGFQANPNNTVTPPPQVAMQVMTDKPLWFYCRQKTHCGKGMVFSVNPTAEKTHAMFKGMAIAQNGTGSASPITGGQQSSAPAAPAQTGSAPSIDSGSASGSAGSAADSTAGSAGGTGATTGQGTIGADGSCQCIVACSSGAFPAAAQGAGSMGGVGGSLPISMGAMGAKK